MSKTSSAVKMKYNKKTYARHEFVIRSDDELAERIKEYKNAGSDLSGLIKELLQTHWSMMKEDPEPVPHPVTKPSAPSLSTRQQRKKAVQSIVIRMNQILEAEEQYKENIPENLQGSIRYTNAEESITVMEEIIGLLETVYGT